MSTQLLLIVIYLAFISLGLPDSLLGAAWPGMYKTLAVPAQYAGIISMIVAAGTVVSSLFSSLVIKRLGVAAVTTGSVFLTAIALLGFSWSHHFLFLCLLAIPLGLGAGSVDASLNNYVALHYEAKHMNWLHCFWGLGAAMGPMIMSAYLAGGQSWTLGYRAVGWIQLCLVFILLLSFPLWKKDKPADDDGRQQAAKTSIRQLLAIPGLKQVLIVFFCYCSIESVFGVWGASYLVFVKNYTAGTAAKVLSFFYIGITAGRLAAGFMATRFSNRQMVIGGQLVLIVGLLLLFLPSRISILPGYLLVGLGCAPIFPALLHETPRNFGRQHSQMIMGIQMASAYIGITLMPLLFGELASRLGYSFFLVFIAIVLAVKIYMNYAMNQIVSKAAENDYS